MNKMALEGVRVADFSMVWAGPYAAAIMGYLGAEIIKIESRKHVDQTRQGSITLGEDYDGVDGSPIFNNANLNKKSVSIDVSTPEGQDLARKIVAESDIVIENMRPGKMAKNHLGYEDLKKVKPDIIMISASGFGATGPYAPYGGYAPIFASIGGLAYLTGYEDGEPNTMSGVMDLRVGTISAFAAMAALVRKQKTGRGMYVDVSSSECISSLIGSDLMGYTLNGVSPQRRGNQDSIMAPHQVYRCKGDDKWVSIAVANQAEWEALVKVMGNPDWAKEDKYRDQYSRWNNRAELDKHMTEWTGHYTDYEVMHILQNAGVAAMPSFCAEEILSDEHIAARGVVTSVEHPLLGKKAVIAPPWKFSETPATIRKSAPLLGESNTEIFEGLLGMSHEEVEKLKEEKVIY